MHTHAMFVKCKLIKHLKPTMVSDWSVSMSVQQPFPVKVGGARPGLTSRGSFSQFSFYDFVLYEQVQIYRKKLSIIICISGVCF